MVHRFARGFWHTSIDYAPGVAGWRRSRIGLPAAWPVRWLMEVLVGLDRRRTAANLCSRDVS